MFYSRRMEIAFVAAFLTLLLLTVAFVLVSSGILMAGLDMLQQHFFVRVHCC